MFSHVAKIINANCVDGTTAQIQENGWYRDKLSDISNPYFDQIDAIVQSSGKITSLLCPMV
jgi:hypothetical protein